MAKTDAIGPFEPVSLDAPAVVERRPGASGCTAGPFGMGLAPVRVGQEAGGGPPQGVERTGPAGLDTHLRATSRQSLLPFHLELARRAIEFGTEHDRSERGGVVSGIWPGALNGGSVWRHHPLVVERAGWSRDARDADPMAEPVSEVLLQPLSECLGGRVWGRRTAMACGGMVIPWRWRVVHCRRWRSRDKGDPQRWGAPGAVCSRCVGRLGGGSGGAVERARVQAAMGTRFRGILLANGIGGVSRWDRKRRRVRLEQPDHLARVAGEGGFVPALRPAVRGWRTSHFVSPSAVVRACAVPSRAGASGVSMTGARR